MKQLLELTEDSGCSYALLLPTVWDLGVLSTCEGHLPSSRVFQMNKNHSRAFWETKKPSQPGWDRLSFLCRTGQGKSRQPVLCEPLQQRCGLLLLHEGLHR